MPEARFETFPDNRGQYRWHLVGVNSEIQAQGEAHRSYRDVERAILEVVQTVQATLVQTENDDDGVRINETPVALDAHAEPLDADSAPSEGEYVAGHPDPPEDV